MYFTLTTIKILKNTHAKVLLIQAAYKYFREKVFKYKYRILFMYLK